ncbi:L-lactate dehydrogenase (quinone) large subunit LdhH [Desulfofundulus salinus]|uniref:(Fe-S)-binding protein n=1 Tax=Desulfofundulus salinus TaxID=2419843 RepID=A0A494WZY6_9FIRM|nr:LUD domain-containing protein [Desulfofundulus salinum]RKO66445.1 (Fe-S)-binding protein [Desulfofundulus salinum]
MSKAALRQATREALANTNVCSALGKFADNYVIAREQAYRHKDFEGLRREVARIKREAAERMEELAAQFTREATRRGATVFRAATAQDAREYIARLARSRGIKTIVKSKSMASEEIHLNKYLKEQGLDAVETDLGEWIIQLACQRPSHMVMPAIHMSRNEVAEIFSREIKKPVEPEISSMVQLARRELRRKFLSSWMGISGANIAVAETGTIVMVTNEGNGRLTTTLPPVHVIIVGLEKLVPCFTDIAPILEVLPRSATAQHITTYVTMITGTVPAVDPDGNYHEKKELHIILLDNGRTRMAADPVFKEALQCVRCAACLNVCPIYQLVGGVFGDVYTGGIGTVLTAFFTDPQKAQQVQNLCLGCGRCRDYCSGNIDLPALISELRRRTVEREGLGYVEKVIFERVLVNRRLFHRLLKTASRLQKPFARGGKIRHLPLFLSGLTEGRTLPAIADIPFRDRVGTLPRPDRATGRVAIFSGCLIDFVYPGIGESVAKVLAALGFEIVHPEQQTCCGYPAKQAGLTNIFAELARQNIAAFAGIDAGHILTACPTCAEALKFLYPELLAGDPVWSKRARALAEKVTDFSSFVFAHREKLVTFMIPLKKKVTYHDSCHLKRRLRVTGEPRQLLIDAGAELVEMTPADLCCGFGGSYSIKFPELSRSVLDRKLQAVLGSGAEVVALDCPGCQMQIGGGMDRQNPRVQVMHTAEILARCLAGTGRVQNG